MQDRRKYPRLPLHLKVGVVLGSGETVFLRSHDVSRQGIQVVGEYGADVDDQFPLFFTVPPVDGGQFERIEAHGRVVHVIYDGSAEGFRIGFFFTEFQGDGRARLARTLEAHYRRLKFN